MGLTDKGASESRDARRPGHEIASSVLQAAVERLAAGGVIAYPTETVWGLGACADRPDAIAELMAWKGRGTNAPLAVLVSSPEVAVGFGCRISPVAAELMKAFWPGPLMLVVPCTTRFAPHVAGPEGALGLRCSSHPLASALAAAAEEAGLGPLTSTSLNRSGEPPARTLEEARQLLSQDLAGAPGQGASGPALVAVEGLDAGQALPSTVVDCAGPSLEVLRVGAIAREEIESVLKRGPQGGVPSNEEQSS